jgi:hypothetical protein
MLIKSIEDIRELVPVSLANDFNRLKPHLENAERDYLVPAIGKNMMLELNEFADATPEGTLTEVQESMLELWNLAKVSLVHLAFWIGYDTLNAYISDGGFRRVETEKYRSLFKYQEDSIRDYFKVTGFNGLDAMLELIDERPDHFLEYFVTETYQQRRELFIRDTQSFHSIYFIGQSRLIFMRLIPYMKTVEDLYIKPIMGTANYTDLKYAMTNPVKPPNAMEIKMNAIIPVIQKPIAFLATALLMEDSGADLGDRGLYFEGRAVNSESNTVRSPTEIGRVINLVKRNRGLGESYLSALKAHMLDFAADWNGYTAPTGRMPNRTNTGKRSVWI